MDRTQFFFCYNKELFTYLHDTKMLEYITIAKNPNTDKTFSMFYKNDDLQKALNEYKQLPELFTVIKESTLHSSFLGFLGRFDFSLNKCKKEPISVKV